MGTRFCVVSVGDVVAFHFVTCNVSSLLLLSILMTRRYWRPNEALWLRLSVTGNSHGLEAVNIFQLPQQKFTSYDAGTTIEYHFFTNTYFIRVYTMCTCLMILCKS